MMQRLTITIVDMHTVNIINAWFKTYNHGNL